MAKAVRRVEPENYQIVWEPQAGPQTALVRCPVFEVFFGGARGGGKSDGVLGEWVCHSDVWGAAASGLMVRRTLRDLEDTIKRSRMIYGPLGAKFNESDKVWRFPNGSEFKFRYLDSDEDADHYQGHSYTRVYIEEIGQFASPVPIFKLMATLRSGTGATCGFRATGNPGGPGHSWVRARYIDPAPQGWKVIDTEFKNPFTGASFTRDRVFIPSKLSDNKYLGDEYVANLQMAGSEKLVRAWLEGDWSIIEGAFFEELSTSRHVLRPFPIPGSWTRFRAGDWGSAKPFCIGWYAVVPDHHILQEGGVQIVLPRGSIVKYREWYGSANHDNVGLKMTAVQVAQGVYEREADEPRGIDGLGAMAYGVMDPSAFKQDGGPSICERMAEPPWRVLWRPADNSRVGRGNGAMGGWNMLRERLIGEGGRPMIYFNSTCVDTLRTLAALQHDASKAEDVDTESEDHAPDETRYACMSRPYTRSKHEVEPWKTIAVGSGNQVNLEELFAANERKQGRGRSLGGQI